MAILTSGEWEEFLAQCPQAHLLQTAAWGDLKACFGWQVARMAQGGAGAQVLFRKLPLGFSLAYLPRGPVWGREGQFYGAAAPGGVQPDEPVTLQEFLSANRELLAELDAECRRRRAIFLKIEPDLWETPSAAPPTGFLPSPQSIQPPRTLLIDLQGDEDQVLNRMKQKTRYNIRLAQKKGVVVRASDDLEAFHKMILVTGGRDGFGVHSLDYYRQAYARFAPQGKCTLLFAEYEGTPLAALMVFLNGERAWYFYGASANEQRERMPTYLLQWEAMRWARAHGAAQYDLWGVPDADEADLEANFTTRSSGLWGVYRFKRGFGGELRRAAGAWDRVYQPGLYRLYTAWANRRQAD